MTKRRNPAQPSLFDDLIEEADPAPAIITPGPKQIATLEFEQVGDKELAEKSDDSGYFPDDPPFLKRAWKTYALLFKQDRFRAIKPGKRPPKKFPVRYETELAFRAYWAAVIEAKAQGHPAFRSLDPRSAVPTCLPPDDEMFDDDD